MSLAQRHTSLHLTKEVEGIVAPFLKKLNLSFFQFMQVQKDGSFSYLCNHAPWLSCVMETILKSKKQAVFSHCSSGQERQEYYFLWDPNLPAEPVQLAREFDITHGLTFVERHASHYNMIAIAAPSSHHSPLDTYFNHLPEIQQFIANFKHEKQALIKSASQCRFELEPSQYDINLEKMLLKGRTQIPVFWQGASSYLTPREYACLKELARGKSVKEIARVFALSPRTIEGYLNRVKERIPCKNNRELILMIQSILF